MKRTITIACVAVAGLAAIAGSVAIGWSHDPHGGAHDAVHAPATNAHDRMVASDTPSADAVCPYTAPAATAPSSCCGAPEQDVTSTDGACGGDH